MLKILFVFLSFLGLVGCEEKISESDLETYKTLMNVRLGHLGNAIIIQGRLLDAYNLRNDRADEDHFKEAEELLKGHLDSFGRPDELKSLKIPNSIQLRGIHDKLIETSELLISSVNLLEDHAWLGGSVSLAERSLDTARFTFQNAVKTIYNIDDEKKIKPIMEHQEYDVGEKPEKLFDQKGNLKTKD